MNYQVIMRHKNKIEVSHDENGDSKTPAVKKAKKRTYSLEEKSVILRDIFASSHEVYSIKELENLVPKKSNGVINLMQLKEVLDYCINESIVSREKCGISNVYYYFPMVERNTHVELFKKQQSVLNFLEIEINKLEEEYNNIMDTGKEWIFENEKLIESKNMEANLEIEIKELQNVLETCDTENMEKNLTIFKKQSNVLKDNIWALTKFIKQKMNLLHLSDTQFLNEAGIDSNEIEILNDYEN